MEILLAVLALEAGIINPQVFVALVIMAVVTSLVSGPAMSRILRPPPSPVLQLLREGAVTLDLPGSSPADVIRGLSQLLADRHGTPELAKTFAERVLEREELSGTGVGEGVAIPHAEVPGLAAPALVLARTEQGIDFDAPDGLPVRLVFMLLTPPRQFESELQVMAAIVRLLVQPEVRNKLLDAEHVEAVLATLADADRAAPRVATPRWRKGKAA
jgi:mannitol/fructose-specific phosphotransferase system IIA component (Ntr-type)